MGIRFTDILRAFVLLMIMSGAVWAEDDVVIKAMNDEMARSMEQLHLKQAEKPYFIAYRMQDADTTIVSATLGSLTASNQSSRRVLSVELRVGDYSLDNSNFFSTRSFSGGSRFSGISTAPLDDNYLELRRQLWLTTDTQYKRAIEDLSAKRAAIQARKRTEELQDFTKETPVKMQGPQTDMKINIAELEQLARELSLPFKQTPDIMTSSVVIEAGNSYMRYMNSEGSLFTRSEPELKLSINAETQAPDGLPIHDSIEFYCRSAADLPQKKELFSQVREMGRRFEKLRSATSIERYNGPVIFEDRAAAEIFAQVFAPGLVTSRTPVNEDPRFEMYFSQLLEKMGGGENFLDKIGGRVLPDFVNLVDNPHIEEYHGMRLLGSSKIDDDAVLTRETRLVEKGILQTLLSSRIPVKSIAHSTGSRSGIGPAPSNLILSSDKKSSNEELRKELLRRVKLRNLPYGIIVRRVGGNGMNSLLRATAMMSGSAQSGPSNLLIEVYKLFPDGHEEPVRGIELNGITAATFRDIVAVGDKPVVYNEQFMPKISSIFSMGMGGASSDLPVVSYVIPSLLFEEITLTKAAGPFPNPPMTKSPLSIKSDNSAK